ncbi:MAG: hypothetical protein ACOY9Y_01440 [Bacillota bacterium]
MSDELYEGSFFHYFITIYDPWQDEKVKHKLIDVLFNVVLQPYAIATSGWK